jgi:hypothetical protein
MRTLLHILIACIMLGAFHSCKKDPETVPDGNVRLIINVNHHGFPTANAVIFRKNGTLIYPGPDTTLYDQRYVADANGNLIIEGLGNGYKTLVLYAKGFDPNWDSTGVTPVSGYQYVSVTTAVGEAKDVTVTIPVSE